MNDAKNAKTEPFVMDIPCPICRCPEVSVQQKAPDEANARKFFIHHPEWTDPSSGDTCSGALNKATFDTDEDAIEAWESLSDDVAGKYGAWARLAMQFDEHRVQAMSVLKAMIADYATAIDYAKEFIEEPPLDGTEVLAHRVANAQIERGPLYAIMKTPAFWDKLVEIDDAKGDRNIKFPLQASVSYDKSSDQWHLEVDGSVNDIEVSSRHVAPNISPDENAPDLTQLTAVQG